MEFNICFMEISNQLTAHRFAQGFVSESATGHLGFGAKTELLDRVFNPQHPSRHENGLAYRRHGAEGE
jgi:hypothetical protein